MNELKQIKKGIVRSQIDISLRETGLDHKLTTYLPFNTNPSTEENFLPYALLENTKIYQKVESPFAKKLFVNSSIVLLVVYYITLFSIFKSISNLLGEFTRLLIYVPVFLWFPVYSLFVKRKVIYLQFGDRLYYIFDTIEGNKIIEEIFTRRNLYLRKAYMENEEAFLSEGTLERLRSLNVINDAEFLKLKEKMEIREKNSIGFNSESDQ